MRVTGERDVGRTGLRALLPPRSDGGGDTPRVAVERTSDEQPLVVIADDSRDFRALVRFELEHERFRVEEAATGEEALDAVHRFQPDLLLLDLSMPDVDGWDVLKQLRCGGCPVGMRVAVLTGDADEMVEQRAQAAGAAAYLAKPISGRDLARALRRLAPAHAAIGVA